MSKTFEHNGEWVEEVPDKGRVGGVVCGMRAFNHHACSSMNDDGRPPQAVGCSDRLVRFVKVEKPAETAAQPASATRPPTRESQIETYLKQQVNIRDGEIRKVTWVGQSKAPDRLVMLPNRADPSPGPTGHTLWVELKAPGKGKTFPADAHERAQAREHARMRAVGQRVFVIDSYEGVDRLLNQYR